MQVNASPVMSDRCVIVPFRFQPTVFPVQAGCYGSEVTEEFSESEEYYEKGELDSDIPPLEESED